ncbi:hypothetical protein VPFG_00182 [Vibrio phage nt-1]|uniref:Uncharacterized protein n=1 Tax=Vibrio phage nt-1 TaxID=115992 RepID=R9TJB5_9CAUD|nr:hypothetical protein VPFG_00182 [Vibrio phage nt-1]AGN30182.1 hypothetical protein VPFG_00182 [Vibrio phage nt-1]
MKKRAWFFVFCGIGAISYFGGLFVASLLIFESVEASILFIILVFLALLNTVRAGIEDDENNKAP